MSCQASGCFCKLRATGKRRIRSRNKGEVESVRYDVVNAMLLNEFLKEHRKVKKLEATVVQQQKKIEALAAGLEKVSNQIELSKAGSRTVANNP